MASLQYKYTTEIKTIIQISVPPILAITQAIFLALDPLPQKVQTYTHTHTHERGCCLTYDYVTDDATDLLGERDLDMISKLGGLLISRPVDSSLSHKNALQRCIEHAKLWLTNSDEPIEPSANVTCNFSIYLWVWLCMFVWCSQ